MTVSSQQSYVEYNADGSTTTFPVPFYFLQGSDLAVTIQSANGTTTDLVYGVNYSALGAGSPSGGAVTLNVAYPTGSKVLILRSPPATQETQYAENGKFPAMSHEKALDKLTMLVQRWSYWWDNLALKKPNYYSTHYDAKNNKISNLADAVSRQDAVTLGYINDLFINSSASASALQALLASSAGAGNVGTTQGMTVQSVLNNVKLPLTSYTFYIPADFASPDALAAYLKLRYYDGNQVTVNISAGTYNWNTLNPLFGREWGFGRVKFVGAAKDTTIIQFFKQDGIYAEAGECYGHAPQFPVSGGDITPIFSNVTLSGIDRDSGIDDPYRDAMGVRAFDGGMVVLNETVRITQFSRVGVMAERGGRAFVPGVTVDTTGSDCFAAYYGGFIYCPNTVADNPKGHCYISGNGGELYMPNCEAKNAVYHTGTVGGSGLVLTGQALAYALNFITHGNVARGVSVALNSYCYAPGLNEYSNGMEVGVSQASTLVMNNGTLNKPNALALLVEKGSTVLCQIASTDTFTITGRVTVQSLSKMHAPDGTITNSSGNSVAAINSTVDLDRTTFLGAPAVAIYAQDGASVKCVAGSSATTTGTTIICQNAHVSADNFQVKGTPSNGFRATQSGRISARNSSVVQAGQYGYTAENMGAFIDATGATVGNAFNGYKATNGGQINGTSSTATGTYGDAAYNPAINTADAKLTLIIK